MSRFRFDIARESDDASLRQLLRSTPSDGQLRIAFCREPSYFDGSSVEGESRQTIICRDMAQGGRVVGMGARAVRNVWVRGERSRLGYLGGLRLLPEYRNTGLVARGYRKLRAIHEEDPVPYYVTTIAEGNTRAWNILTSGRAGLPRYRYLCDYRTTAIPLVCRNPRSSALKSSCRYDIQRGTLSCLQDVTEFWRRHAQVRDLFPEYRQKDLEASDGLLRGFDIEQLLIARLDGDIVGTLGVWDQTGFRQSMVQDYGFWLRTLRPVVNLWSTIRGRAGLPAVGETLRLLFAAIPVVNETHADCFRHLLVTARNLAAGRGFGHLVLGMTDHDPLWKMTPPRLGVVYRTRVCTVHWDRDACLHDPPLESPYLEAGCL